MRLKDYIEVYPGMGVTWMCGSDMNPGTIIEVSKNRKRVVCQEDKSIRDSEEQVYNYERNPLGETFVFTKRNNGRWVMLKHKNSPSLALGVRRKYLDPHF